MTTPAIPAEPIYIGGQPYFVKFFLMPRAPGEPPRIEGFFTAVGDTGVLTLDALVGPQGEPGEPSPIIRPQWGSTVTAVEDLPDVATLDETDSGRAWYIDGQWHVYDNNSYHVIQGSIPGPVGATPDISVSAEQIEAASPVVYGAIEVVESGTTLNPHFHLKIPGVPGPEGPMGSIEGIVAEEGDFIRWNGTAWEAAAPTFLAPKLYTIPHSSFVDHTGSEARFLIASLNVPAHDFDWYPDVSGHVRISRSFLSSVEFEVEVRIGDTGVGTGEAEQLCGLAPYDPTFALLDSAQIMHISPHWSETATPSFALNPDTAAGRVLSGQAKTIYVFIHVTAGSGSYQFTKAGAHLRVMVVPAA